MRIPFFLKNAPLPSTAKAIFGKTRCKKADSKELIAKCILLAPAMYITGGGSGDWCEKVAATADETYGKGENGRGGRGGGEVREREREREKQTDKERHSTHINVRREEERERERGRDIPQRGRRRH